MLRKFVIAAVALASVLFSPAAMATTCSTPSTLANGQPADAHDVVGIITCINIYVAPLASPSFTGSVGIVTTIPVGMLSLQGPAGSGLKVQSTGAYSILDFINSGGEDYIVPSSDTLNFFTGPIGAPVLHMTIDGSGNVGIGVVPAQRLSLADGSVLEIGVNNASSAANYLKLWRSTTSPSYSYDFGTIGTVLDGAVTSGQETLNIGGRNIALRYGVGTIGAVLNSSGNFGIGNANPQQLLDLKGTDNTAVGSGTFWNGTFKGEWIRNASDTANTVSGIGFLSGSANNAVTGIGSIEEGTTLSALAFFTGGSGRSSTVPERMRIDSAGNVGIGTTSPGFLLTVNGTAYATTFTSTSDRRRKTDIRPVLDGAVALVMQLKPVTFLWKDPRDDGMRGRQIGFIAQDVMPVLPDAVLTMNDADKTLGLKYDSFIPVLTKAIQEQQSRIDVLAAANRAQAVFIRQLQMQVSALLRKSGIRTAAN